MDVSAEDRWIIGFCMALLNCGLSAVGFTLQRKAQLLDEAHSALLDVGSATLPGRSFRAVGIGLYIAAAAPDVVAYAMAPQLVCVTVSCFRLVLVTFLAHFYLKEHVRSNEVIGTAICSVGTFLCLACGPRPNEALRPVGVAEICSPEVLSYMLVGVSILLVMIVLLHADLAGCVIPKALLYSILPAATGLAYGLEKVFNTEIGFMKPPANVIESTLQWTPWMTMSACIVMLGLTDFYLNLRGAQRMPVQIFVPISFACGSTLQFGQAMFIFNEFKGMAVIRIFVSFLGAALSLVGALVIQPPQCESLPSYISVLTFSSSENDSELAKMPSPSDS